MAMAEIKVPIQVNLPDDWVEQIVNRLRSDPETEWVEIVRCKDCKHRPIEKFDGIIPPKKDDWKCPCLCDDYFYSWRPKDNFFCANGERREDE